MEVRQYPAQALIFLGRAEKGTKLKTEVMELLGKLAPPSSRVQGGHAPKTSNRQFFGSSTRGVGFR